MLLLDRPKLCKEFENREMFEYKPRKKFTDAVNIITNHSNHAAFTNKCFSLHNRQY